MRALLLPLLLLLAGCSSATRSPSSTSSLEQLQRAWAPSEFTDPAHHNPKNFRYLITALVDTDTLAAAEKRFKYYGVAPAKGHYLISASAISESRGIAYSTHVVRTDEIGFILSAPASAFVGASEKDTVTKNAWDENGHFIPAADGIVGDGPDDYEAYREWFFTTYGLPSPEELLSKTFMEIPARKLILHKYNEAVVEQGPGVKVTGVFFFDNRMPEIPRREDPARAKNLRKIAKQLAAKYRLPYLELKVPPPIRQ